MAKKSLGYVELEWTCPTCKTRNPGSQRVCAGCGNPQPPDVKFEAPAQSAPSQDKATVAQATAGPDLHCPYCDARNPVGAKVCKQCGGDLTTAQARTAGQVVEGFGAKTATVKCTACGTENPANLRNCKNCGTALPAARPTPKPAAAATTGGRGCMWIAIGLALLVVIGVAIMLFRGNSSMAATGTVVDTRWVRTIEVQGLVPARYTGWLDEIPTDADIGACTDEVRATVDYEPEGNNREVCGTPYAVDQGTGFGEVVQDCAYEVLAQRCEFTVNEWRTVEEITSDGAGFTPEWPTLALNGREREGDRNESFQCIFAVDGTNYTYQTRSFDEYLACSPGSTWSLEVNSNGRVLSAVPAQ